MASRFVGEGGLNHKFVDLYLPVNCWHIDPNIKNRENANSI